MTELIIFYKDADQDILSLEIRQTSELEKWITEHPSLIYYLKHGRDIYKLTRAANSPPSQPIITATNKAMSELTFTSGNNLANFLKQYKCSEYYLQIDQRVFVIHRDYNVYTDGLNIK